MLDKSIKHMRVVMVAHDTKNYPRYELPEGYKFSGYKDGYDKLWAEVTHNIGHTDTLEEAEKIFRDEFMIYPEMLAGQCMFVLDGKDNVVATGSIWKNAFFGEMLPNLHWITTSAEHQGKGIMKALLTRLFDIHNQVNDKNFMYLISSTWSYKAVNLYKKFGFVPHIEDNEESPLAWEAINEKIAAYQK